MSYFIDYINDSFYRLSINEELDEDEFDNENRKFKGIHIYWDSQIYGWKIPKEKIDEFILWCTKFWNEKISFTEYALKQLEQDNGKVPRELKVQRGVKFDYSLLSDKVKRFDYQKDGFDWMVARNRVYSSDDKGVGKTILGITYISYLYNEKKIDKIILLTKKGLIYHWFYEILEFSTLFKEEDIICIDNQNKKEKVFTKYKDKKIFIIPHNLLADVFISYKPNNKVKKKTRINWKKYNVNLHEELNSNKLGIVSDEHHYYKHSSSAKTKALLNHIQYFEYRLFLSATPAINNFMDYYTQLLMLDKFLVPFSEKAFALHLAKDIGGRFNKYKINEFDEKAVHEVQENMKLYFLKRLKEDLPEMKYKKFVKPIYFKLSNLHEKIYTETCNVVFSTTKEHELTENNVFSKFIYVLLAIDNPFLLKGKVNTKVDLLLNRWSIDYDSRIHYLDDFLYEQIGELDEKIIVYDTHPLTLDILNERYKKYSPLMVHGQIKIKEDKAVYARRIEDLFNDKDNEHKLLLLSSLTSSQGLNLQRGGNKTIVFTSGNDTTDNDQLQDRTHRIVSERDSFVDFFVYRETFDNIRYQRNMDRETFNKLFAGKGIKKENLNNMMKGII